MDRFTWAIVVGAVALVGIALVAVLLVQRAPTPPDLATPDGVVRAYLAALDSNRPEQAWDLLSEQLKRETPRDEFVRRASNSYHPSREGRVAIENVAIEGSSARVEMSRTYSSDGGLFDLFEPSTYTNRFTARLEQQSGAWRITVPPEDFFGRRPPAPPAVVVTVTPVTPATPSASPTRTP